MASGGDNMDLSLLAFIVVLFLPLGAIIGLRLFLQKVSDGGKCKYKNK